jgi:phosphoribosylglycinamide formyltransferase 1
LKNKIVVLASGSGTNFQSIIDSIQSGFIDAVITKLIVNREDIGAIDRAKKAGIPVDIISPVIFSESGEFERRLLASIREAKPDLIVLAGYLLKLPGLIIKSYEGQIINIHPSLLPAYGGKGFYGMNVHRAVISDRQNISGCTVHIVTEEFDEGPILSQSTVPVYESDTAEDLANRILQVEHQLFPKTIKQLLEAKENEHR